MLWKDNDDWFFYQLRHMKTKEITSVMRRREGHWNVPGLLLHGEDEGVYEPVINFFKAEKISRAEYETLLAMHDVDWNHESQEKRTDFWLFTGGDCP